VKNDAGKLVEEIYRARELPTARFRRGRYAQFLKKANEYLEKAQAYGRAGQDQAIAAADPLLPDRASRADWIRLGRPGAEQRARDFANGFIEVYRRMRAQPRATAQSFVPSPMRS